MKITNMITFLKWIELREEMAPSTSTSTSTSTDSAAQSDTNSIGDNSTSDSIERDSATKTTDVAKVPCRLGYGCCGFSCFSFRNYINKKRRKKKKKKNKEK